MTLNRLPVGKAGRVCALTLTGATRRRLLDLGLIEGTKVACIRRSPAGDPILYYFRDTMIALRNEDSKHITVEVVDPCE